MYKNIIFVAFFITSSAVGVTYSSANVLTAQASKGVSMICEITDTHGACADQCKYSPLFFEWVCL